MKLADHCGTMLVERAAQDSRIIVLDGDLCDSDGAVHFALAYPERFLMSGIAEQNMVSMAAGMASSGLRPFVFSFAAFLCFRAYDQIRVSLSQNVQPVTLIGASAGGLSGRNGRTHTAQNDLALLLTLPNMNVWAPADLHDLEAALEMSLTTSLPTYIRLPRSIYDFGLILEPPMGRLRWNLPIARTVLVSTGLGTVWAVEALRVLTSQGLHLGHLHLPCLSPLPDLSDELSEVKDFIIIEDHCVFGGLASLLSPLVGERGMLAIGWPRQYDGKSGDEQDIRGLYGLTTTQIVGTIISYVARREKPTR